MPIQTITDPTEAELLKDKIRNYQKRSRCDIDPDQKFAIVLLKLAPAVTQANYPALGAAIQAIAGIQGVELLIDGKVPSDVPVDAAYKAHCHGWLAVHDDPAVEVPK